MSEHNAMPVHTPESFGEVAAGSAGTAGTAETGDSAGTAADLTAALFVGDVRALAPEAKEGEKPAVTRIHSGQRANHILFRFTPGQQLREHMAAHPITVSCPEGSLRFIVEGQEPVLLQGGMMLYLPARIPHAVEAGADGGVLWLIMHTG